MTPHSRHALFSLPLFLGLLVGMMPRPLGAHPLSQGALDVVIHPEAVTIGVRVTVEEVMVTNRVTSPDAAPDPFAGQDSSTYEQHAAYLASHLRVIADGVRLPGGVVKVEAPANAQPAGTDTASYELIYPILSKSPPRTIDIQDEVLTDAKFAPGVSWQSNYVVRIGQYGAPAVQGLLLTPDTPVHFDCDWNSASPRAGTAAGAANRGRIFKDYFLHGIHHIFSIRDPGYDHLLFVTALVLGATTLWELFKLVTAFTLAHTITLTLAALNLVHVSERVVEPLIALSIVFVAVENVAWPSHSRGWTRLGVAFFFGLFHGLGFAGALLEAMQGMSGSVVLFAILAFSLGVETAHQMVVLPLFAILKLARQTRSGPTARQRFSYRVQRYGSIAIAMAGLFYLAVALRFSLGR